MVTQMVAGGGKTFHGRTASWIVGKDGCPWQAAWSGLWWLPDRGRSKKQLSECVHNVGWRSRGRRRCSRLACAHALANRQSCATAPDCASREGDGAVLIVGFAVAQDRVTWQLDAKSRLASAGRGVNLARRIDETREVAHVLLRAAAAVAISRVDALLNKGNLHGGSDGAREDRDSSLPKLLPRAA
eukprot:1633630-Pleurochrysis_carterae.AAC.1